MIKDRTPISNAEVLEYIEKKQEKSELVGFIRKFTAITPEEAKELKQKLKDLEILKLGEKEIVKIIEILPEDEEDLNKIAIDVSLNEDETKKILDTIKEYK